MSKVPFKRFVITFLLFNKGVPFIVEKLKSFGYEASDDEIGEIFTELRSTLPSKYRDLIENRGHFMVDDPGHVQWLKQLDIFEFYDFIVRKDEEKDDPPEYFKWCMDCMWAHGHRDVMTIINILMFNNEPLEDISKIIMFKFRKKISIDALELYRKMFWDTTVITAKEALYYCSPFRKNTLVVRQIRGGAEITQIDNEANDGSDVPFTFHDSNYVKWKIGYRDISVPTSRDFLERVKTDSYYRYYESMNMNQSIEIEEEEGTNDKLGDFENTKTKKRNVEEQRAKMSKYWLDIYLKANNALPSEGPQTEDFFEKMKQMDLDFCDEEKIAKIDELPGMLADIKGDMNELEVPEM